MSNVTCCCCASDPRGGNTRRRTMSYRLMFFALSVCYTALSPIVNLFVPLKKDAVFVSDLTLKTETSSQYPVLDFVGLVQQHNYVAEEHIVTSDGYILKLHRISGGPGNPPAAGKPVAYMQHGMLQSSDSFVTIGPDTDLAYQLVKAGYDVWLGNPRGNAYSKAHVSKNPTSAEFWDFSFHEMALHDVPAMIDYILRVTKQKDLTYYGFSMGTTISYVMLAMRPEYNEKLNLVYSLAPAAFWNHDLRKIAYAIHASVNIMKAFFDYFNANQLLPMTAVAGYLGKKYCADRNTFIQPICAFAAGQGFSMDFSRMNRTALPTILAHNPAGTSKWVILHYEQNADYHSFQGYDYGRYKNMKKYGQELPPVYNLTNVRAPVIMWYGRHDDLVNEKDTLDLAKQLPNLVSVNRVKHDNFNHVDFLWSVDAKRLVYDNIVKKV